MTCCWEKNDALKIKNDTLCWDEQRVVMCDTMCCDGFALRWGDFLPPVGISLTLDGVEKCLKLTKQKVSKIAFCLLFVRRIVSQSSAYFWRRPKVREDEHPTLRWGGVVPFLEEDKGSETAKHEHIFGSSPNSP